MTPRQRAFAEQYIIDHRGADAAVRAGYAPRAARQTGYELLAKPAVQALVAEQEVEAERSLGLSRERVVEETKGGHRLGLRTKGVVLLEFVASGVAYYRV